MTQSPIRAAAMLFAATLLLIDSVSAQQPPASKATPTSSKAAKPSAKTQAVEMAKEPRALELLKAASERLAAAKSMSFTALVTYEFPSQLGPALAYTTKSEVTMQRPNKLKVITLGDGPASEFYYDGKNMMAFAPAENLVAVAAAPPTIDATLQVAYDTAAIYYPFTDLIVVDPYPALVDGLKLAFYIGQSKIIGGTTTDMVAIANDNVFMQIWIGTDDKLPRMVRAVFRADPLRLRHQLEISDWKLEPAMGADAFVSAKAASAKRIAFAVPKVSTTPPGVKPPSASRASAKSASSASKPQ